MDVAMPQLGETVTEGTITRWCKAIGDRVGPDDVLFEVSTDKVDSEVPAPGAGVLTEIRVPVGETVAVGTVLAVIAAADTAAPAAASAAAPAAAPPAPSPPPAAPVAPASPPVAPPTPAAAPEAPVAPPAPAAPVASSGADRRLTSPVVRRLLAQHGLTADEVPGTGEGGRITRRDVEAVIDARGPVPVAAPAPAPSAAPASPATPTVAAVAATPTTAVGPPVRVEPLSVMRRRIGEHMVASQATSAHAYTSVEVDFERVVRARAAHREAWKEREGFSLTFLPFIVRAVSDVFDRFPVVNASIDGESVVLHPSLHLSVAVDLDFQGLITPVVRDADGKRLRLIAREINDLATRSRGKRLSPDEILGGTFTITNPGPYGTYQTLAIINQPQVAILSTDGIAKRAVVIEGPDGGDAIAIRHTGLLTLGWDHRAFDGAYAAAFLGAVREVLETRDWETELE